MDESENVADDTVWQPLPVVEELAPGATTVASTGNISLLVCRLGAELLAYYDRCVRCGRSLQGARLAGGSEATDEPLLVCPDCGAGYDVCRAGTAIDDPAAHLTPVPLLVEGGTTFVAVSDLQRSG